MYKRICHKCGKQFQSYHWNKQLCDDCKPRENHPVCYLCGRHLLHLGRGGYDPKELRCSFCLQRERTIENELRRQQKRVTKLCQVCGKWKMTVSPNGICKKCLSNMPKCGICGKNAPLSPLGYCRECTKEIKQVINQ